MKTFAFACLFILLSTVCPAQETEEGRVIIAIDPSEEKIKQITLPDFADTLFEVGTYFNNNYPDNKINTDLKPDIARFFPDLTTQQLYDRESLIRNSIKIFRWGKDKIAEIKASFLAPDVPVLTYKDSDYEIPSKKPYVDVGDNNALITTDIKKVISYSSDPKEVESYQAFRKRNEDTSKIEAAFPGIARLKRLYEKIELKKLPFYGLIYADPKTNGEGITPWHKLEHAQLRVATEESRLEQNTQIRGVIHFGTDAGWHLLAFTHGRFPSPEIDFSGSENLKDCAFFSPTPHRTLFDDGDLITYTGNFGIPFLCSVIDNTVPAVISTDISFSLCNNEKKCLTEHASPKLTINAGNGFSTVMQNFIVQSFTHLPDTEEKDVVFRDISVEDNRRSPSGKTLRLIVDVNTSFNSPDFFVRTDENTVFSRPRIAIDGNRISARLDIITPDSNLIGKPAEITMLLNRSDSYRFIKEVMSSSIFDINSTKLTIGLFLLAMLGGFLLNFMPCVFPVLSLKILSLTHFGAQNTADVKTGFTLSALGIFSSFTVLAAVLSGLKIVGKNLGWGMQFQNPVFLTTMIFAMLLFLGQLYDILPFNFTFGKKAGRRRFSPAWEAFFSGIFVVIMATPCTGPYLGTTIGFALAGTPLDIFAIFGAVALGLSLPYLLLLMFPDLSLFIPRPGEWMQKLHRIMSIMLLLTILWLINILRAQSSWETACGISILALLFYLGLYLYRNILIEAERVTGRQAEKHYRIRRILHAICSLVLLILFVIALVIGNNGFSRHRQNTTKQTSAELDFERIAKDVDAGANVLVKIGADWCLTCGYNNLLVFDNLSTQEIYKKYNIKIINIDWTGYNPEILDFMSEYGRRGLPFYILYNKNIPEGLVLPELLNQMQFEQIINQAGVIPVSTD